MRLSCREVHALGAAVMIAALVPEPRPPPPPVKLSKKGKALREVVRQTQEGREPERYTTHTYYGITTNTFRDLILKFLRRGRGASGQGD
jgi:hypothetical protein